MSELNDLIWVEKYRPQTFKDLILENKPLILNAIKNPKKIPSFIFYSSNAGTGKTSTAKIIINTLKCDFIIINSSDERGIDTIREKIKSFSRSLSSNSNMKRCVFLDEADGLTRQAQDSLRNLMETYSANCFFIFSCNDISKVIEPLRSRCISINFNRPDKNDILVRLEEICEKEKIKYGIDELEKLVDTLYPDIRSMVLRLQQHNIDGQDINFDEEEFKVFFNEIKKKNIKLIYDKTYSGIFDIRAFNKWLFHYLFINYSNFNSDIIAKISQHLADTEKHWNLGANLELIFISNILNISNLI